MQCFVVFILLFEMNTHALILREDCILLLCAFVDSRKSALFVIYIRVCVHLLCAINLQCTVIEVLGFGGGGEGYNLH